jgi:hypothetical protein
MKMESGGTVATAANSYVSPPPPPMPPGSAAAAHFNAAAAFQAAQAAAAAGGGPNGGNGNAAAAAAAMAAAQNAASVSQFQEALMSRMHAAAAAGRNFGLTVRRPRSLFSIFHRGFAWDHLMRCIFPEIFWRKNQTPFAVYFYPNITCLQSHGYRKVQKSDLLTNQSTTKAKLYISL